MIAMVGMEKMRELRGDIAKKNTLTIYKGLANQVRHDPIGLFKLALCSRIPVTISPVSTSNPSQPAANARIELVHSLVQ